MCAVTGPKATDLRPGRPVLWRLYFQILIEPYTKYKLVWSWFYHCPLFLFCEGLVLLYDTVSDEGEGLVQGVTKLITTFSAFET